MENSNQQFQIEVFSPSASSWENIREVIIELENEAFGEHAFTPEELAEDFSNKNNIILLLKNIENVIIGFTYAKPIEDAEPSRANEKGETGYLWDIVIEKEYRGRKLTPILMNGMEEELKRLNYKYIDLDAVRANNYAENVSKVYKDRIIKSEPHDSRWGPQIYFRIKL